MVGRNRIQDDGAGEWGESEVAQARAIRHAPADEDEIYNQICKGVSMMKLTKAQQKKLLEIWRRPDSTRKAKTFRRGSTRTGSRT